MLIEYPQAGSVYVTQPTGAGLAVGVAIALELGLAAADFVLDGDPQAPTSTRRPNAAANRNVNMTLSPAKLCRSSRSFELAVITLNGAAAVWLLFRPDQ
jgi:hypothetical protein